MVFNHDKDKLLVVKEHGENSKWKLPGGLADLGENIEEAIQREIFEETGVRARFKSILTVRHAHEIQFGRSDLYFTCHLTAESEDILIDAEIQDATWMTPEQLKKECPFPTVLTALEMLFTNNLDRGFTGKEFFPSYYRAPYRLYSTKVLESLDFGSNKYISGGPAAGDANSDNK
jgi:ADP-ribose pyrophosphatase YjhB (NUDIX family)